MKFRDSTIIQRFSLNILNWTQKFGNILRVRVFYNKIKAKEENLDESYLLPRDVVQPSNDPELAATYKILVRRAIGSAFLDVRRVVARIIKSVRRGRRETKDGHQ